MKRKGFTLVEMLVAIGIFSVFMGVLMTSYMSVVKGLRGAEEYRIMYADARNIFDTILENGRNSTVYGCGDNTEFSINNQISFCSTDGVKKVTFKYEAGNPGERDEEKTFGTLTMTNWKKDDLLIVGSGYAQDGSPVELNTKTKGINVKSFSFDVFPKTDPFSSGYEGDIPYQPVVIVKATFEKESASGSTYVLPLETAISLRTYR